MAIKIRHSSTPNSAEEILREASRKVTSANVRVHFITKDPSDYRCVFVPQRRCHRVIIICETQAAQGHWLSRPSCPPPQNEASSSSLFKLQFTFMRLLHWQANKVKTRFLGQLHMKSQVREEPWSRQKKMTSRHHPKSSTTSPRTNKSNPHMKSIFHNWN